MTKEDIQLALRLVAHGRVNHPQVEELAEKLAGVLASNERMTATEVLASPINRIPVAEFVAAVDEALAAAPSALPSFAELSGTEPAREQAPHKRTRKPKAE